MTDNKGTSEPATCHAGRVGSRHQGCGAAEVCASCGPQTSALRLGGSYGRDTAGSILQPASITPTPGHPLHQIAEWLLSRLVHTMLQTQAADLMQSFKQPLSRRAPASSKDRCEVECLASSVCTFGSAQQTHGPSKSPGSLQYHAV